MSSHDCLLRGTVVLKPEFLPEQIAAELLDIFDKADLDIRQWPSGEHYSFDDGCLFLDFPLATFGGSDNEAVRVVAEGLGHICAAGGYIELLDFDTGSAEEHCCPYFFGQTETDRLAARLNYGIARFEEWAEGLLAPRDMIEITKLIHARSRLPFAQESFTGTFTLGETVVPLEFSLPTEAPALLFDEACLAALAQVGRLNVHRDTDGETVGEK